jgi:transposase
MAKRVEVKTELTAEALHERYRQASDAVERSHWHMLWLLKEGKSTKEVAALLGYSARWVREIVRRWNERGAAGISDHRAQIAGAKPLLGNELRTELALRLQQPPEDGGLWTGPKVAAWMQERLGRPVAPQRGWDYLRLVGYSARVPRRQHAKADREQQEAFKKTFQPSWR